ncbi:MAG: FAD:protein FMN transferase [Planctomycetaceae bacterium]
MMFKFVHGLSRSLLVAGVLLALVVRGQAAEPPLQGETMGTTWHVLLAPVADSEEQSRLQVAIDARLQAINQAMSTYRDDSDLSRFNASESTEWFDCMRDTAVVTARALEIAKLSDGAFDPTVAPLIRLWNFDRDRQAPRVPDAAELEAAAAGIGYQHISVRLDPPAIKKDEPRTELNLSAIAKGYAVDEVARLLVAAGRASFMVEIGGEVVTRGKKGDGTAWSIGIERPLDDGRAVAARLPLTDAALATSGDYRNFFMSDGRRYSHTIDPRTHEPVTHSLASVTVLAEDCMTADALATTLMVLGPEQGRAFANEQGVAAWLLRRDGEGFVDEASTAFTTGPGAALEEFGDVKEAAAGPSPWTTLIGALAFFALAILGLGIGLLVRGRELPGSCGGLSGMKDAQGNSLCGTCTIPPEQCDEFRRRGRKGRCEGEADAQRGLRRRTITAEGGCVSVAPRGRRAVFTGATPRFVPRRTATARAAAATFAAA